LRKSLGERSQREKKQGNVNGPIPRELVVGKKREKELWRNLKETVEMKKRLYLGDTQP